MKAVRIITITIFSIFATIYLAFLFVLPNSIDLNQYSPQITKIIQDNTGFLVNLKGLKVSTAWNLSGGAKIDKTDLMYPDGKKFAQIDGLEIKLSLIPMILGSIRLDSISAEKVLANWDTNKELHDFQIKHSKNSNIKYSIHMPKISVGKYRISLLKGQKDYTLKGQDLDIHDFILNKKIKVKTNGNVILNGNKQIAYNISIFSKTFPKSEKQKLDLMKIFDDFYKYRFIAKVDADLKLDEDKINGLLNLDGVSFKIGEKTFPKSTLKLNFKGDKAKINSTFYTDLNSKILAYGWLKTGKNKSIDLQASSDKIDIKNLLLIAKTLSNTFKFKDLSQIEADGILKANFSIKSDFKKIKSSGYLKVKNASTTNKTYNVKLSNINADLDFSQDAIHIKQANAKLNEQPITIKGMIDSKANANIYVLANRLQLKGLLLTSGNTKVLKENDILSGLVDLNVTLKGKLDKATPQIGVLISNVDIRNKASKCRIKLPKMVVNSIEQKKNNANLTLTGLKIKPNSPSTISIPKINLLYDGKNLNLETTTLFLDNIRTILSGRIDTPTTNPTLRTVKIAIPNQISVPIAGYPNSSIKLKGDLILNGNVQNPDIEGVFNVPSIRIPSILTGIQNTTVKINKNYTTISCPQIQIADSFMGLNAQISNDFTNGITARNLDLAASNLNLNTIIQIAKQMPKNGQLNLRILDGKSSIERFKIGNIVSTRITNDISMDKNVLLAENIMADAYNGKVGGYISYDFSHLKTNIDLQGRNLSANPALLALTGRNDDIYGVMDFDTDVSISNGSKNAILKSLNGDTNFIINNGKMGILGKFEHLLYAQNVVSNNVFKASLNLMAKAITAKNTGVYKYMKGKVAFSNGWANIQWVKTSGPSMSLYLTGRYYMPENTANITILGRISDDIVGILGPLGEFSMNKAISSIPKVGEINAFIASQYTTNPNYENTSQIPPLSLQTEFKTKEFKVIIDGDVRKQNSVKTFKWLSTPKIVEGQAQPYTPPKQAQPEIPDFVKNLPDLKN